MRTRILCLFAALAAGVTAPTHAGIINVAAGGNVQAAVDSAAASGDEVVLAAGNYSGSISISGKSLVLRGASAASRPVFSFTGTVVYGTSAGAGMAIRGDLTSVTVENITFLPGTTGFTGAVKGLATATLTAGSTQTVTVNNCIFAPNDGSNQPLFTDPFADPTITNAWPNDIFYFNNGAFVGAPAGGGIYTVKDSTLIGAGRDGFICYPNAPGSSLTVSGTAISHSARCGTQWGDNGLASTAFTVTGTRSKPGLILRNNCRTLASAGSTVDGINAAGVVNINRLVYVANGANAIGFVIDPDETAGVTITNSLFASNTGRGLFLADSGTFTPSVTVANNTFFANGTGLDITSPDPTYVVRDNVFAGAGTGINLGTGVGAKVTLQNNALVTAGSNALTAQTSGEAAASNTGTVTADPQFTSTSSASLAALQTAFNVTNGAYATASSTAGPLSGWGIAAPAPAAAADWTLFE